MREKPSHLTWLSMMPCRAKLPPLEAAQEARDIAEHEVGRCLEAIPRAPGRQERDELREQLAFWSGEVRRAELEFQRLMAAEG